MNRHTAKCCRPQRPSHVGRARLWIVLACLLVILGQTRQTLIEAQMPPKRVMLAEPTWNLVAPTGWGTRPTTVSVNTSDADGLQPSSMEYRTSDDGSASWTIWRSDSLQVSAPTSTTVQATATVAENAFIDSTTANRIQFRILDALGSMNFSPIYVLQIDGTAPGAPIGLTATPSDWTSQNNFTLNWTNPAGELSGVVVAYYKIGNAPAFPDDYTSFRQGSSISQITGVTVPGAGEFPCYVWLGDAAGNANYASAQRVTLRYTGGPPPPPSNLQITPSDWDRTCRYTLTWTNPPTSTVPAGIQAAWYKWGSAPNNNNDGTRVAGPNIQRLENLIPPNGTTQRIWVWLEDGAGNRDYRNTSNVEAKCDQIPPLSTPTFAPPLPASGWFSSSVTVTLSVTDAGGSGVKESWWRRQGGLWYKSNSWTATEYSTYEYYSVDFAGNTESTKTLVMQIDTVPPTSSVALSPPTATCQGWYTGPVSVSITAVDDRSGWANESYYRLDGGPWRPGTTVTITENGSHSFEYYSRDRAGNTESPHLVSEICRIDREPPLITATVQTTGTCGWVSPPATIALTGSDRHSGLDRIEYRLQGTTTWREGNTIIVDEGDGVYTYEVRARDRACNISEIKTISVNIDATPPGPPSALVITPSTWSKVNAFEVCWTNPPDMSGIKKAYYRIGSQTFPPVQGDDIRCLSVVSAPMEGEQVICVELEDCAGNIGPEVCGTLRYDASPPSLDQPTVQGPRCAGSDFYTGVATVTIKARDDLSGIAALLYQVEGEPMVTVPISPTINVVERSFPFYFEGARKIVRFGTTDAAGNTLAPRDGHAITLRFDSLPPASPTGVTVDPAGWSFTNSFTLTWTNPEDSSGVIAAYIKKGSPPTSNNDGELYSLVGCANCISGLTVEEERAVPVYIWLVDRACNTDYRTAALTFLRYDITAPQTGLTVISGTQGRNFYYTTPIRVRFLVTETASGVAATYYTISGSPERLWDGQDVTIEREGTYTLTYYSIDNAGNREAAKTLSPPYRLDFFAPTSDLSMATNYVQAASVDVTWLGRDTAQGSGIEWYTVEYKVGCGDWQVWLRNTANTSGRFTAMMPNNFYYFRVKAEDRAGNVSAWSLDDRDFVYYEGLGNPSFDLGNWGAWVPCPDSEGRLTTRVVFTTTHTGASSHMARLSRDDWPLRQVPADAWACFWQPIQLPDLNCGRKLTLSFWYHIITYDQAWGENTQRWYDTFEVWIYNANNEPLRQVFLDGYFGRHVPGERYDLGWKYAAIDLSPWAGQSIRIRFVVWNRHDTEYPTWVYVDDVKLLPSWTVHLPMIRKPAQAMAAPQAVPTTMPQQEKPRLFDENGLPIR